MKELHKPSLIQRRGTIALRLGKDILNFQQLPTESVFEAWERFKSCSRKCPDHKILLLDQIFTFYHGITMIDQEKIMMAAVDNSIPLDIDNGIYDSEGDILFLEKIEDEHSQVKKSEINPLIREPSNTFLMGDEEIKLNSHKNIDDLVPILRTIISLIFRMRIVVSPNGDYNGRCANS
uniref:Reverse transcriptase domain-containing protein n=1 Tax=Tanacetum cinerariifolium TaxID=118510 RepID=A0A6L2LE25_TANCI|nr:reverse transcriptase domain-containing protein [Tanacetum cinerariifolium]